MYLSAHVVIVLLIQPINSSTVFSHLFRLLKNEVQTPSTLGTLEDVEDGTHDVILTILELF